VIHPSVRAPRVLIQGFSLAVVVLEGNFAILPLLLGV